MRTLGRCDSGPEGRNATDDVCLGRLREGDLHGFEPIYDRHHAHAESVARTLVGTCAARDLTSEAFARLVVLVLDGRGPETEVRGFLTGSISAAFHQRVTRVAQRARATGKASVFSGMVREAVSVSGTRGASVQPFRRTGVPCFVTLPSTTFVVRSSTNSSNGSPRPWARDGSCVSQTGRPIANAAVTEPVDQPRSCYTSQNPLSILRPLSERAETRAGAGSGWVRAIREVVARTRSGLDVAPPWLLRGSATSTCWVDVDRARLS